MNKPTLTSTESVLLYAIERLGEYPLAGRIMEELDNPTKSSRWWKHLPWDFQESWHILSRETRLALAFWAADLAHECLDWED